MFNSCLGRADLTGESEMMYETYDLILCECVCGRRVGYPASRDRAIDGFVCDACFLKYRFEAGTEPLRVELTNSDGDSYPLGFCVFSLKRSNQEFAEDMVEAWFSENSWVASSSVASA
jgi:hypothetical protein